jgi:CspA family cold shock protein
LPFTEVISQETVLTVEIRRISFMAEGRIKWYNEKKGYGFIESDEEGDVFVHRTGIEDHGFFTLRTDDRVSFEIKETQRGRQAINVKRI